jgi:hypothetical protein
MDRQTSLTEVLTAGPKQEAAAAPAERGPGMTPAVLPSPPGEVSPENSESARGKASSPPGEAEAGASGSGPGPLVSPLRPDQRWPPGFGPSLRLQGLGGWGLSVDMAPAEAAAGGRGQAARKLRGTPPADVACLVALGCGDQTIRLISVPRPLQAGTLGGPDAEGAAPPPSCPAPPAPAASVAGALMAPPRPLSSPGPLMLWKGIKAQVTCVAYHPASTSESCSLPPPLLPRLL